MWFMGPKTITTVTSKITDKTVIKKLEILGELPNVTEIQGEHLLLENRLAQCRIVTNLEFIKYLQSTVEQRTVKQDMPVSSTVKDQLSDFSGTYVKKTTR